MIKRHQDLVENELENLTFYGKAELGWRFLIQAYGQERMSKSIWRDIADRLPDGWTMDDIVIFEGTETFVLLSKENLKEGSGVA